MHEVNEVFKEIPIVLPALKVGNNFFQDVLLML